MIIQVYDREEHGRLVGAKSERETARAECVKKMHDMHQAGESKSWDAPDHLAYQQLKSKVDFLDLEMKDIDAKISQYDAIKPVEAKEAKKKREADALDRWVRKGPNGLEDWERKLNQESLEKAGSVPDRGFAIPFDSSLFEFNGGRPQNAPPATSTLSPGTGGRGDVGQEEVIPGVVSGLKDFGGAFNAVTVTRTSHGNDMKYVISDETTTGAATAVAVGDTSANYITEQTVGDLQALAERTFSAKLFNTKYTDVSRFMAEDVTWNVGAFVRGELMRRMGRLVETQLMTGTGSSPQIWGLETRASEYTTKAGAAGKFVWQDLIDLMHSVEPGYLMGERGLYGYEARAGQRAFLTSWPFKGHIAKMADNYNRPVLLPNLQQGLPDMVYGYPLLISQNFTDTTEAAGKRPIIFGNFGYHVFRIAGMGLTIEQHYDSATAMSNTWRFFGRMRVDADVITPFVNTNKTAAYTIAKIKS